MKEIQPPQQPARAALEVVADGRSLQTINQEAAAFQVYGSYVTVDTPAAGYSVTAVSARDAQRLRRKPPISRLEFGMKTTIAELSGAIGVLLYGIVDATVVNPSTGVPATDLLIGAGGLIAGGAGAAAERTRRMRQYRRVIGETSKVANQNFIPNIGITFPELDPETPVAYGDDNKVAYGELWSTVSGLQERFSNPLPKNTLPERRLHAANLMRGMVANYWSDDGRREFLSAAIEPWMALKTGLERLRVYGDAADASPSLKQMHEPQALQAAGAVAGVVASFLDTRGMELHGSASQQYTQAETEHAMRADQDVVDLLTARGVVSQARANVVWSVDTAYRHG